MHNKRAKQLPDLVDDQWVSLNALVCALEQPPGQTMGVVKRLVSAFAVEGVRPARIIFYNESGQLLLDNDSTTDNETLTAIVGHKLKSSYERTQASEQVQRPCYGAIVEFTKPSLHEWLIRCDLPEVADNLFGTWMDSVYPKLTRHNLMRLPRNKTIRSFDSLQEPNVNDSANTLTLTDGELVELTDRKRGSAQHSVLQSMRIPSKLRADGAVVVLRQDLHSSTNQKIKPIA